MSESPFSGEALECLRYELWSLVRPNDVWCSISAKYVEKGTGKAGGGHVLAHVNDLWSVSTTVNNNEELSSAIGAEIDGYFLKWL